LSGKDLTDILEKIDGKDGEMSPEEMLEEVKKLL
jgi:hypothetical protein